VPSGTRPTSARTREALFSIVGQDLEGARFLDACAGTGAVGLEAWSRGAEVTLVERAPAALRALGANVAALGARVTVVRGDIFAVAPRLEAFDVVFCDPPYAEAPEPLLIVLAPLARATLVYEASSAATAPASVGSLALDRVRHYGEGALWVFRAQGGGA
jgi:16S rRNA (guanine(966)-N(2))-methyltransferase RsmD